jgi:GST-like protein
LGTRLGFLDVPTSPGGRKKVTLDHPIFTRWPAQYPGRLQLFSLPTPNGVKVGIMLEETSLAYPG